MNIETIPLRLVRPWDLNPRGGEYRNLQPLIDSIRIRGILEPLDVWRDAVGEARLLGGHRRLEAARRLDLADVPVRWHECDDECAAYGLLLELQQSGDPFDVYESAVGARNAVQLGMTVDEVAPLVHRSPRTVQQWLSVFDLSTKGQDAVRKGDLSLATVQLLLELPQGPEETARDEALQMVLHDSVTGAPMAPAQAKALIETRFVRPLKWRDEWRRRSAEIVRDYGDGHVGIRWEERLQYVLSETGEPAPGYAWADEFVADNRLVNPREPIRWGDLAQLRGAPIYVVPAPRHENDHVVLVRERMVMDAERCRHDNDESTILRIPGKKTPAPPIPPDPDTSPLIPDTASSSQVLNTLTDDDSRACDPAPGQEFTVEIDDAQHECCRGLLQLISCVERVICDGAERVLIQAQTAGDDGEDW